MLLEAPCQPDEFLGMTTFDLVRCGRNINRAEERYTVVRSPFARVLVPTKGKAFYSMYGRKIELTPGGAMVVPCDATLECHHLDGWSVDWLYCRVNLAGITDLFSLVPPTNLVIRDPRAASTIDRLLKAMRRGGLGDRLQATARLVELASLFFGDVPADLLARSLTEFRRIDPVLRYIEVNLGKPMSLAELAELMHLSPKYFANLFSDTMGVGPIAYVNRRRVQRAKEMLATSELNVKEIAAKVGFANPLYFSRQFGQIAGLSPTDYRRTCGLPK